LDGLRHAGPRLADVALCGLGTFAALVAAFRPPLRFAERNVVQVYRHVQAPG
jgi:hypothetical protein